VYIFKYQIYIVYYKYVCLLLIIEYFQHKTQWVTGYFLVEDVTQMTPGFDGAIVNRQSGEVIYYSVDES